MKKDNVESELPITGKPFDDSNWREEYKNYTSNKKQLELLENGPKSLAQSWFMQAMHTDWMKQNGYKYPPPPDCQSSFKEWENSITNINDFEQPPNKQ